MNLPEPYRQADQTLSNLKRKILNRLNKEKRTLLMTDFDELNVRKSIDRLYDRIESDCRKAFEELYEDRYAELWMYMKDRKPDWEALDELVELYLVWLWDEPHPVTHYAFGAEMARKRDRAKEAIISVPTKTQKQLELEKAMRYLLQQIAWYTDFTSQDAEIQAYEDAGVKRVQRHEMNDASVCQVCKKLDGKIYRIKQIPPLEHLRCRRWFTQVIEKQPDRGRCVK